MMFHASLKSLFCWVLLLGISPGAYAIDCQEKSPNFIDQGEKYFDLPETKPLAREQITALKKILKPLDSRLTGKGTYYQCKGKPEDNNVISSKEKVKMQYRIQSDGTLIIEFDIDNMRKKSSYSETIQAFNSGDFYTLDKISDNSFTMTEKMRRAYPNGFSRLIERIVVMTVNDGKLNIEISQYHNGYFADLTIRTLH